MALVEIKCRILNIGQLQTFESGFYKKDLKIVETEGNYPQTYTIECHKAKSDMLDMYNVNDIVTIKANLNGKEYTDKNGNLRNITSLSLYQINKEHLASPSHTPSSQPQQNHGQPQFQQPTNGADDLPF